MKFLKITLASILGLLIIAFIATYILYVKNNTEVLTLDEAAAKMFPVALSNLQMALHTMNWPDRILVK